MKRSIRPFVDLPELFCGEFPCYRTYKCQDGRRISLGAIEHKFWEAFCSVVGTEKHIDDAYATGELRDKVVELIQQKLASRPWREWAPLFEAANCCVEPIMDYAEVDFGGL